MPLAATTAESSHNQSTKVPSVTNMRFAYLLCKVRPALFHTQGGVLADAHANVITTAGEAIPGLFASGGAASGISGHGASGYLAGNGLLSAFGMSFLAAESFLAKPSDESIQERA